MGALLLSTPPAPQPVKAVERRASHTIRRTRRRVFMSGDCNADCAGRHRAEFALESQRFLAKDVSNSFRFLLLTLYKAPSIVRPNPARIVRGSYKEDP